MFHLRKQRFPSHSNAFYDHKLKNPKGGFLAYELIQVKQICNKNDLP